MCRSFPSAPWPLRKRRNRTSSPLRERPNYFATTGGLCTEKNPEHPAFELSPPALQSCGRKTCLVGGPTASGACVAYPIQIRAMAFRPHCSIRPVPHKYKTFTRWLCPALAPFWYLLRWSAPPATRSASGVHSATLLPPRFCATCLPHPDVCLPTCSFSGPEPARESDGRRSF